MLVAQSMGALSAPLAVERADVAALLLVAPMILEPGESLGAGGPTAAASAAARAAERAAGRDPDAPFDPRSVFFHDVPDEVTEAFFARAEPEQSDTPFAEPWPLSTLAGRADARARGTTRPALSLRLRARAQRAAARPRARHDRQRAPPGARATPTSSPPGCGRRVAAS